MNQVTEKKNPIPNNQIYIGNKNLMVYINSILMLVNSKKYDVITVSARGKFISKAVDSVEIVRNKFLKDKLVIDKINISSQTSTRENKTFNISIIDINLKSIN